MDIFYNLSEFFEKNVEIFYFSRTAIEAIEEIKEGPGSRWDIITNERTRQYRSRSDIEFLRLDEKTALNLANCVKNPIGDSPKCFRTSGLGFNYDKKFNYCLQRVKIFYMAQSKLHYANSQLQAIFFDLLVIEHTLKYRELTASAICTITQPCHAFNIVSIKNINNERDWYLYDTWAGHKRVRLGSFKYLTRTHLDQLQSSGYQSFYKENQNATNEALQLCTNIILHYGRLFGVSNVNDIEEIAKKVGLTKENYILSYLTFSDAATYYEIGLGGNNIIITLIYMKKEMSGNKNMQIK